MRTHYRLLLLPLLITAAFLDANATTASSVTLTSSPSPSTYGSTVTLTATVTAGATGTVTFYDGAVALGSSPIVAGTASFSTPSLAAGVRRLTAYYRGDSSFAPSASAVRIHAVAAVSGNVFGATTLTLGLSSYQGALAVADFNRDGKSDLVWAGLQGALTMLANGNGTFQPVHIISFGVGVPVAHPLAIADFNADGNLDIALAQQNPSVVLMLLGNGDGTFQTGVTLNITSIPESLAQGDFNSDGNVDLVVMEQNRISLYRGAGDGNFLPPVDCGVTGAFHQLAVGDFNGDRKADLAIVEAGASGMGGIKIVLGNGDGSFRSPVLFDTPLANGILVEDFDRDGLDDLAVGVDASVQVLLGTADGAMRDKGARSLPGYVNAMVAKGDFDGDGRVDLVAGIQTGEILVLPGNGDGTFNNWFEYALRSPYASSVVEGDFNGDGRTDVALSENSLGITILNNVNGQIARSGTPQNAFLGQAFASPLAVTITDVATGSPVSGATVLYTHSGYPADAVLSSSTAVTNAAGVASITATANNTAGSYHIYAFCGALYNGFYLTNVAELPAALTAVSGTPQSVAAGMPFTVPLKISLKNSSNQPVSGAAVWFSAPSGILLSAASATTDASGLAQVWATAGDQPGSYSVVASSGGLSVTFDLTVLSPVALSLATSPNPSNFGQPVTLTATVPPGITGKVTFYDGPAILGTATIVGQTASRSTILLPPGARAITALYGGDSAHPATRSVSMTQTVAAATNSSFAFGSATPVGEAYTTGHYPGGGVVADFNGDGKPDIAVANGIANGVGSISVLLGNGDGTFRPAISRPLNGEASYVAAGDFNGDGQTDLAAAVSGLGIVILLGNGDGSLSQTAAYSVGSVYAIAVTDLNRDGLADLVALDYATGNLMVLSGNGDGTFQPAVTYNTGASYASSLVVADFNGDGAPDFALPNGSSTYSVSVFLGNPDGTLQRAQDVLAGSIQALAAGDFNRDGKVDLITVGAQSWTVLTGNGDGTFQFQSYTSYPTWVNYPVVADFNGDGKLDAALVYGNSGSQGVLLLFGNGNGSLQSPVPYQGSSSFRTAGVGAFTGGGKPNVVLVDSENRSVLLLRDSAPAVTISSTHASGIWQGLIGASYVLTVTNNQATATAGVITVRDTLPAGLAATGIGGSGWNCDLPTLTCARADSLAPGASYPSIILVFDIAPNSPTQVVNSAAVSVAGSAPFVATDPTGIRVPLTRTTTTLTVSPSTAVLGQSVTLRASVPSAWLGLVIFYDGDTTLGSGRLDDASKTAALTTNALPVGTRMLRAYFRGNGVDAPSTSATVPLVVRSAASQGFSPLGGYTVTGNAYSIVAADLNGDGKSDLAIANGSGVSILLGSGNATFQPPVDYTANRASTFIASGDFNGDGKADLVTANPDGNDVTVFLANADGTLQAGVNYPAGASPHSVAVGDLDGDGILDLAVPNFGSATLTILLGKSDGTFRQFVTYSVAAAPYYVAIGDFNGDAKPDLAVTSSTGSVTILISQAAGIFQPAAAIAAGGSPIAIATGDFNGDGKLDLAVAGASANNITVLLGNGSGTFRTPVNFSAGGNPVALAAGDFNGDGNLDVAVANSSSAGAGVLFGNGDGSFRPPTVYAAGSSTTALATGDFNGDGRADLAVTTGNTGFVASPHLSRAVGRAASGSGSNVLIFQGAPSVAPVATATTVQSSANPAVVNQAVTFTAYITPAAAAGSAQFVIDGNNFGAPVTVTGGTAVSTPIASLPAGNHTVTANFIGTGNYANSSGSVTGGLTVNTAFTAALAGAIASKQGPANARVWTFTVTYTGSGAASAAQIAGVTFTQTGLGGGQACSPAILTPFPVALGAISAGGSAQGSVTVDFTGCANAASFSVQAQLSANNGALTGSITRNHQYR